MYITVTFNYLFKCNSRNTLNMVFKITKNEILVTPYFITEFYILYSGASRPHLVESDFTVSVVYSISDVLTGY